MLQRMAGTLMRRHQQKRTATMIQFMMMRALAALMCIAMVQILHSEAGFMLFHVPDLMSSVRKRKYRGFLHFEMDVLLDWHVREASGAIAPYQAIENNLL